MTLAGVKIDDIVLVNKKGREFVALVIGKTDTGLKIRPADTRITYREVNAREVVGHWGKRARSRVPAEPSTLAAA